MATGDYMAIAVCVTASLTILSPGLRAPAFLFAGLFLLNGWLLGFVHGWPKFVACIGAELLIAYCLSKFRHRGADWIVKTSYALAITHALALLGFFTGFFDPFYQNWDVTVPAIEAGQCIGIIVSSDWCFNRIAAHARKKKEVTTWLAMTFVPR